MKTGAIGFRFYFIVLVVFFSSVSCLGTENLQLLLNKTFAAGVTHIAGDYRFTNMNFLVEGAEKLNSLGVKNVFFYLTPDFRNGYPDGAVGEQWPEAQPKSLAELAKTAPYKRAFSLPFETIVLTAYSFSVGDCVVGCGNLRDSAAKEENEFYELTKYLIQTYQGTGKTFILKHWEGDWIALRNYDTSKGVEKARADDMVTWISARQRGVEKAREELSSVKGVLVLHAIEVNRVLDFSRRHLDRVVNLVVPKVRTDMVAYSSYDAMIGGDASDRTAVVSNLTEALQVIDEMAPDPLGLGKKRIFISEFGLYENEITSRAEDVWHSEVYWRTNAVLDAAKSFGISFAFFWELFDNECHGSGGKDLGSRNALAVGDPDRPTNKTCRGLWIIRPDGSAGPALPVLTPYFSPTRVIRNGLK